MSTKSEYAQAGVDPQKIGQWKDIIKAAGRRTLSFPLRRRVRVKASAHGVRYWCFDNCPREFFSTQEGLGNKNWIAEWMYQFAGTGKTYYDGIGWDNALMAVNDLIATGHLPVAYLNEVAAGDSDWFADAKRATDLAESYFDICQEAGMALPGGESPALRYLVKAEPPVTSAPVLSGCAIGVRSFGNEFNGAIIPGDRIIGFTSSGIHCNGISAIIRRAMQLPDQFLTKLPNGKTLGEEVLTKTRSYVALIEALQHAETPIKRFLPGTGDGVAKLAIKRFPFTHVIEQWPQIPLLIELLREIGMSIEDTLTTFNCGIGYYAFVEPQYVEETITVASKAGYEAWYLGEVSEGDRQVIFGPGGDLKLRPQDE